MEDRVYTGDRGYYVSFTLFYLASTIVLSTLAVSAVVSGCWFMAVIATMEAIVMGVAPMISGWRTLKRIAALKRRCLVEEAESYNPLAQEIDSLVERYGS